MQRSSSFALRTYFTATLMGVLLAIGPRVDAQSYPAKPIRIVIPFAPGGSADTILRPLAERLASALGQPVVVDTRAGGLTVIGADHVAKAPPDGYTLYLMAGTHVLLPYLAKSVPFDPIGAFTPISVIGSQPYLFVSHPGQPFNSMAEMIAYAKAQPGKLSLGVSDAVTRLAAESLVAGAKIDASIVPYKGGGPVTNDLLGGHLAVGIASPLLLSYAKDGKLKALAVSAPKRISQAPDLPTVEEAANLPGYDVQTWYAIAGPSGLPRPIVDRLNAELRRIVAEPEMRKRFDQVGWVAASDSTPEGMKALMQSYQDRMGKLIQASGIQPE